MAEEVLDGPDVGAVVDQHMAGGVMHGKGTRLPRLPTHSVDADRAGEPPARSAVPALLTSMSSRPCSASIAAAAAWMVVGDLGFQPAPLTAPPDVPALPAPSCWPKHSLH